MIENFKSELDTNPNHIIACINIKEPGKDQSTSLTQFLSDKEVEDALNINYYEANKASLQKESIEGEVRSFLFSPLDSRDKFSRDYESCTGIIGVGKDKLTGKNISFLTHQNIFSTSFDERKEKFEEILRSKIRELKEKSIDGSLNFLIVGGVYRRPSYPNKDEGELYIQHVKSLNDIFLEEIGKTQNFMGPKIIEVHDDIYFENKTRRVYHKTTKNIHLPNIKEPEFTPSFIGSDIENQIEQWEDKLKKKF